MRIRRHGIEDRNGHARQKNQRRTAHPFASSFPRKSDDRVTTKPTVDNHHGYRQHVFKSVRPLDDTRLGRLMLFGATRLFFDHHPVSTSTSKGADSQT